MMVIQSIEYVASFPTYGLCPKADIPEFAFIGRSNVGKSSLINYVSGRKKVARTSKQPGKTQFLNFFIVDDAWHIVDLPGYGYAKVSQKERQRWDIMIKNYLHHRYQLQNAFLLIDINVPPQRIDLDMIQWLGENQISFVILFTKSDRNHADMNEVALRAFEKKLLETWEVMPPYYMTSASGKMGREQILDHIDRVNDSFQGQKSIHA